MRSLVGAVAGVILLSAAFLWLRPAALQAAPPGARLQDQQDQKEPKIHADSALSPDEPVRTQSGSVFGNVTDKSGKPVVGATVLLTDDVTKESWPVKTGVHGGYRFSLLAAGDYTLKAKKGGLQSDETSVEVDNGKASRQDLAMN